MNKKLLEETLQIAGYGTFQADLINNTWTGTPLLYAILGLDESFPHNHFPWTNIIHPDYYHEILALYHQSVVSKKKFTAEFKIIRPFEKEERWLQVNAELQFNLDDEAITLFGTVKDISEQKFTEELLLKSGKEAYDFKYALDQSANISITDDMGTIIYVNDNFCKLSGYPKEFLLGKNHRVINSGYHPKEMWTHVWNQLLNGKVVRLDIKNRKKDGSLFWSDTTLVPLLDNKGKPFQFIAIRYDITKRKNTELELEKRNEEIKTTNAELDRFVYSASHELRSPLTSILGLISLIEDESEEAETLKHAAMIHERIKRLDDFIKQILTFSQNKRTEIFSEKIEIDTLVHQIIEDLKHGKNAQNIEFSVKINTKTDFYSDSNRLTIILSNLIGNAIKYQNPTEVKPFITISVECDASNAVFEISDNGIGISEHHISKIFDMFYRVSPGQTGNGVGLYLVSETVKTLGGTITVESQLKKGTTFSCKIPNMKSKT